MNRFKVFMIVPEADLRTFKFCDYDHPNVEGILTLNSCDINHDVGRMLTSDLVVTVGDWNEDSNCVKAVQVARIMEKEVVHESQFKNYVEANHN